MACKDMIIALHECHQTGLMHRYLGGCNDLKHELNMCLRKERIERTTHNRERAKERRKTTVDAWRKIEEE
ncbi:hypothetical protein BOTBODRAFT_33159 [Botryobasidium botryosum FD-172 SS1]|uniref:COX assembly mitochondrial protein n=1 Tax=Botryobasidium botryosum (strain FD-172 SS1) TaxID=930990 RepID=A0A067ME43_BOTB1|nr:hypothetical protein BOTBODRAFT_33159 [Botryobasidium botryosum FD-172 SS1]